MTHRYVTPLQNVLFTNENKHGVRAANNKIVQQKQDTMNMVQCEFKR